MHSQTCARADILGRVLVVCESMFARRLTISPFISLVFFLLACPLLCLSLSGFHHVPLLRILRGRHVSDVDSPLSILSLLRAAGLGQARRRRGVSTPSSIPSITRLRAGKG